MQFQAITPAGARTVVCAARRAIQHKPWMGDFDPLQGIILYEPGDDTRTVIGSTVAARATLRADLPVLATS
jgi:hypothetical protein